MIKFKSASGKNFLSIGRKPIKYVFENGKISLIKGTNGAGKTALIDILNYAFYGNAFRNINNPQLVNSINKKELEVVVEFDVGNVEYKIERGQRPGFFRIYQDGELIPLDSSSLDYQRMLETKILRMDQRTFKQIVILGSKAYVPFMQLPLSGRRAVIEDLLDLGVFSTMNKVTKSKINSIVNEAAKNELEIKFLEKSILNIEEFLESLSKQDSDKIKEHQDAINRSRETIKTKSDLKIEIEKKLNVVNTNLSKIDIKKLQTQRDSVISRRASLASHQTKLESEMGFFEENSECPKCHQEINKEFKEKIVCEHEEKHKDFEVLVEKANELLDFLNTQITSHRKLVEQKSSLDIDLLTVNSDIERQQQTIDMLVRELENKTISTDSRIQEQQNKLAELNDKLSEENNRQIELTIQANRLEYILSMVKDTGIKSRIIEKYIPIINHLVSKYLSIMESDIDFQFDNDFKEIIKARHRDSFSYASFSEGEKLRIDLALLFSWREIARLRNSSATNLMIFDEIGDSSLDADGFEYFLKIIQNEKEKQAVFIISHSPEKIIGKCDKVYHFEKVGNFTTLKEYQENKTEGSLT